VVPTSKRFGTTKPPENSSPTCEPSWPVTRRPRISGSGLPVHLSNARAWGGGPARPRRPSSWHEGPLKKPPPYKSVGGLTRSPRLSQRALWLDPHTLEVLTARYAHGHTRATGQFPVRDVRVRCRAREHWGPRGSHLTYPETGGTPRWSSSPSWFNQCAGIRDRLHQSTVRDAERSHVHESRASPPHYI